jgi:anion-transporting  ArsA/GET3 family ATPase
VSLSTVVRGKQVIVVAGAGGVGKTSCSAALALGLARTGLSTCVVTVDPARRLATALGLSSLGSEPELVPIEASGTLHASMLDVSGTLDGLIERYAPSLTVRDEILANPIYGTLRSATAGTGEYMAAETLYELHESGRFDVIVLDTPPSRNAVDFLDAPQRLTRFVESRALRMLLGRGARAGRLGVRVAGRGTALALKAFELITGAGVLRDISAFLGSMESLVTGFEGRAASVERLLSSDITTFVLVTGPNPEPMDEAVEFFRELRLRDLPFGGVVVNRVTPLHLVDGDLGTVRARALDELGAAGVEPTLAGALAVTLEETQRRAIRERERSERLGDRLGRPPVIVEELPADLRDLEGLRHIAEALLAPDGRPDTVGARPPAPSGTRPETRA